MTAPLKPWEVGMMGTGADLPYIPNNYPNRLHSSANPYPGGGGGTVTIPSTTGSAALPALPPRPSQTRPIYSARSSMMPYSSSYGGGYNSPYGSGGYYNSSPYSYGGGGYGASYGMGMGMGSYNRPYGYGQGFGQNGEPSFSQMAEESASPAFQSIQSFVGAFCSISAMLDSTFHALYSSFHAVVGVADHLGRVKQILSALTIFKTIKWIFRRFLYLVGISKIKPADIESLWNNLSSDGTSANGDAFELLQPGGASKPSSWPIVMFLGFIFAGPYLMWKLIKSLNLDPARQDRRQWAAGESEHFIAAAEYPFQPMSDRELELRPGQMVRLAPSKFQPADVKGWVLASDGVKIGLIPTSYIKIKGKKSKDTRPLDQQQSFVPSSSPNLSPQNFPRHVTNETTKPVHKKSHSGNGAHSLPKPLPPPVIEASSGVSSDDDTDTLVGDPMDD